MPTLHMRDFLTINKTDVRYPKKATDSNSLFVKAHATHSGTVNGNYRFYRPDSMQKACHTWVPDNMSRRPVIINHNEHSDVLGRVMEARYVDESYKWSNEYPIIKDSLFYKTDGKKVGLFESVDWVVDNLVPIKDYTGLGYIELGMKISNPEAIEKVLRDEYLTVSVGFTTDSAICSICHQDWAADDRCEHAPGEMVDNKKTFLICGPKVYDEVSFVNFPADPFASVFSKESLKDNLQKIFFLGQTTGQRNKAITFSDSLFTDDITHPEGNMDNLDTLIAEGKFDDILQAIKSDALDAVKASDIKTSLQNWTPTSDEDKTRKRSLVSTLNAQIRKKDLNKKEDSTTVDNEILSAINETTTATTVCEDGACYPDLAQYDEVDHAYFNDTEGIIAEMAIELADLAAEGEDVTDAKLTDRVFDASGFCGPNNSFPVVHCAHATVARRVLAKSKLSSDTKSKILGCVNKKAGMLGCPVQSGKDPSVANPAVTPTDSEVSDKISRFAGDSFADSKEALVTFTKLDSMYDASDEDCKTKMRSMQSAMQQDWYADDYVSYMKGVLAGKDFVAVNKQDLEDKENAVNELTDEITSYKTAYDNQKTINMSLLSTYKKALATQIIIDKIQKRQEGYVGLDAAARKDKVATLAKRHVEYLIETVNDILSEAKFEDTTPIETTPELGLEVSDTARIGESAEITTEPAMTDTNHVVVIPRYYTSQERRQAYLQHLYDAAKKA